MSQREVFAIAIKVFSLWFLCWLFMNVINVIPILSTLGSWRGNETPTWGYIAVSSSFLLSGFIISRLLFSVSNSILIKMSSDNDITLTESTHKFVLQVSGLFFIVDALISLPQSLVFILGEDIKGIQYAYLLNPFGYLLQATIGAWLVLHSSWWVLLFHKLRGRA